MTNKLYFGKSTVTNIESYTGSGIHWLRHIKLHGKNNVETVWISDWFDDPYDIEEFALLFSKENDIVNNTDWLNLIPEDGLRGGFLTKEIIEQQRINQIKTKSSQEWKDTVGALAIEKVNLTKSTTEWQETTGVEWKNKLSANRLSPEWIENVGKDAIEKYKNTISDKLWIDSVGKEMCKNISKKLSSEEWQNSDNGQKWKHGISSTRLDPQWIEETGKFAIEKYKDTIWSDEWRDTTGKEMRENMRKVKQSEEYKLRNTHICPIPSCRKNIIGMGNLKRHIKIHEREDGITI